MATENRRRLHDSRDQDGPLHAGASERVVESSVVMERDGVARDGVARDLSEPGTERTMARPSRLSIRPSAFGIPRSRFAERAVESSGVERISQPPRRPSVPPALSEPPRVSQTVRKKAAGTAQPLAVKTDIEELLPISQGVKSLPRPPKLPTFEAPQLPPPTTRRFPWMSLCIFAVVVGASLPPLLRYRGERSTSVGKSRKEPSLREVDWASLTPLDNQREPALWGLGREQRLEAAERALGLGDLRGAERAFTDALTLRDEDPSAAFGLARTRLAMGDVAGARAWAEAALRRRPQNEHFRAFIERLPPALELR